MTDSLLYYCKEEKGGLRMVSGSGLSYSFTQRPSSMSSLTGWPRPSRNVRNIHGFPPTPPSDGCLAN